MKATPAERGSFFCALLLFGGFACPAQMPNASANANGVQTAAKDGDMGANINAAIALLPTVPPRAPGEPPQHCGMVEVPTGTYAYRTAWVKPNCVMVQGNGAHLRYLGTGFAAVEAGLTTPATLNATGGISNLWLEGPGYSNGSVGLLVGGDPSGLVVPSTYVAYQQNNYNVTIENFQYGVMFGGYSSLDSFHGGNIMNNGVNVWVPGNTRGAGENYDFYGVLLNNAYTAGIIDDLCAEVKMYGGGIDYTGGSPGQPFYQGNKLAITGACVNFEGHGVHIEQAGGPLVNARGPHASFVMFGGEIYVSSRQPNMQPTAYVIGEGPDSRIVLDGVNIFGDHRMTSYVQWTDTGQHGSVSIVNPVNEVTVPLLTGRDGKLELGNVVSTAAMAGGPGVATAASWTEGSGAPPSNCLVNGSLYSNTAGVAGTTLYVCVAGRWTAVK